MRSLTPGRAVRRFGAAHPSGEEAAHDADAAATFVQVGPDGSTLTATVAPAEDDGPSLDFLHGAGRLRLSLGGRVKARQSPRRQPHSQLPSPIPVPLPWLMK